MPHHPTTFEMNAFKSGFMCYRYVPKPRTGTQNSGPGLSISGSWKERNLNSAPKPLLVYQLESNRTSTGFKYAASENTNF